MKMPTITKDDDSSTAAAAETAASAALSENNKTASQADFADGGKPSRNDDSNHTVAINEEEDDDDMIDDSQVPAKSDDASGGETESEDTNEIGSSYHEDEEYNITVCETSKDEDAAIAPDGDSLKEVKQNNVIVNPSSKSPTKLPLTRKPAQRKRRKSRPYGFPKRPLSAYNIFFKEIREQILETEGKKSFNDLVRMVSQRWKDVSSDEKRKYNMLATMDMARYKRQVREFEKGNNEEKTYAKERECQVKDQNKIRAEELRDVAEGYVNRNEFASGSKSALNSGKSSGGTVSGDLLTAGRSGVALAVSLKQSKLDQLSDEDLEATRLRLTSDLRAVEDAILRRLLRQHHVGAAHRSSFGMNPTVEQLRAGRNGLGTMPVFAQRDGGFGRTSSQLELRRRLLRSSHPPTVEGLRDSFALTTSADHQLLLMALQQENAARVPFEGTNPALPSNAGTHSAASYEDILFRSQQAYQQLSVNSIGNYFHTAHGSTAIDSSLGSSGSALPIVHGTDLLKHLTDKELCQLIDQTKGSHGKTE